MTEDRDYCTYTLSKEGGTWRESQVAITADEMEKFSSGELKPIYHAYKFASGRVWDEVNGWRPSTKSELPSYAPSFETVQERTGRMFGTGAYRDTDHSKLDYEAFLSPVVLERYAQYMHKHRTQSDGKLRDGDNWQKGIPRDVYMKSGLRHMIDWWILHRHGDSTSLELEEALCALLFNVQGYLFECLKEQNENRPIAQTFSARVTD